MRARCDGVSCDRLAGQRVLAVGRRIEQSEDRQKRRLAATRWTFHGHVLAVPDVEVDVGERVGLHLVGVEDLLDAFEPDQGVGHDGVRVGCESDGRN